MAAVARCILEEGADEEAGHGDADEPHERNQTELVVVCHVYVETREEYRVHLRVQARVDEVVSDLAEAARKCDVYEENHTADAHHYMEHVFISLSHDHGHMMLLHLLWDNNRNENH